MLSLRGFSAVILPPWFFSTGTRPDRCFNPIAQENNLSETAFVFLHTRPFRIRWIPPRVAVDFCGHATLAAAHILFVPHGVSEKPLPAVSRNGLLQVASRNGWLILDFPADHLKTVEPLPSLIASLRETPEQVTKSRDDYMAVFPDKKLVKTLQPDMAQLEQVGARGIIVTAPGKTGDFISRFFAPRVGIPEDPVTGSVHTSLVPYWSRRLGKKQLQARQLSRRGGALTCWQEGERVKIPATDTTRSKETPHESQPFFFQHIIGGPGRLFPYGKNWASRACLWYHSHR